jgi:hypothetical protein
MNRSNKSLSKHSMDGLYQDIVEIPSDEVWETRTSPTFFTVKNHSELALMRFWRGTRRSTEGSRFHSLVRTDRRRSRCRLEDGWLILGELAIKGAWGEKLVGVSTEMAWGSHSSPIHSLISSRCSCLAWGLKAFVESIQAQPTRSARR